MYNEEQISKILGITIDELKIHSKKIDESNATYYWNENKGGLQIIVDANGQYLASTSAITFDKLLEEFNSGKRNGKLDNTQKDICRSCGNELNIDYSAIPDNIKTFDIMCPNCKSFYKFGNPNYKEKSNDNLATIDKLNDIIKQTSKGNDILCDKLAKYVNAVLPPDKVEEKINMIKKLSQYDDIFKEFSDFLLTGQIREDSNSVREEGYTAYGILVKEPCLPTHVAYIWLSDLRSNSDNKQNILRDLKNGISNTNLFKAIYNIKIIRKYLSNNSNYSEEELNQYLKPFYINRDITGEFADWIQTKKFNENNPVNEQGYTIKKLFELYSTKLDAKDIFSIMLKLRKNPEQTLKDISAI